MLPADVKVCIVAGCESVLCGVTYPKGN
jgi:hypothetical protein